MMNIEDEVNLLKNIIIRLQEKLIEQAEINARHQIYFSEIAKRLQDLEEDTATDDMPRDEPDKLLLQFKQNINNLQPESKIDELKGYC